ncbi:MAG: hypothetical protein CME65_04370 [Halobacteriovoraceae bacterium]|nr:hypothetical protein [Halobacteriovoraceae bacterium]|tara:strand:+ start:3082 stop:4338 length:1257 start_codon:yes stop_codon:yes gene_type:complete
MKKIFFSLITSIIVVALIEIILSAAVLILRIDADKEVVSEGSDKIRILALGESTTDDYWGEKDLGAWPRQLEKLLKEKGYPVKSFNVARGGTTSTFILSNLEKNLDKYKPHIVISMMGINDMNRFVYEGDREVSIRNFSWIHSLKTVKIVKWLLSENSKQSTDILKDQFPADFLQVADQLEKNKFLSVDQLPFTPKAKNDCELSSYYRQASLYNLERVEFQMVNKYQQTMTRKALKLCPKSTYNLFWYFHSHNFTAQSRKTCREDFKLVEDFIDIISDETFISIVKCFEGENRPDSINRILKEKNIGLVQDQIEDTKKNYQILHQILRSRGIAHIAMQYPTLPIATLKNYFSKDDKIVFVENRENFAPYLGKKYYEVFKDRFRKTWGHTNQIGHGMIAQQVLGPVEEVIRDLKLKPLK